MIEFNTIGEVQKLLSHVAKELTSVIEEHENTTKALEDFLSALQHEIEQQKKKKEEEKPKLPTDCGYYATKVVEKILNKNKEICPEQAVDVINALPKAIQISLLLKEIAVEIDGLYPDHIKNCKEVYYISTFDGSIKSVNMPVRLNNFAAFRNPEDASLALNILKSGGYSLVSNGK